MPETLLLHAKYMDKLIINSNICLTQTEKCSIIALRNGGMQMRIKEFVDKVKNNGSELYVGIEWPWGNACFTLDSADEISVDDGEISIGYEGEHLRLDLKDMFVVPEASNTLLIFKNREGVVVSLYFM